MADTTANLGNGLQQTFPFMKLPPEIRVVVYELAIRDHCRQIDKTNPIRCPRSVNELPLDAQLEILDSKKHEATNLMSKSESKAAPYLGALALLHISKLVYWESYNAMHDIVKKHISASNADWAEIFETLSKPFILEILSARYFLYAGIAEVSLEKMVEKSLSNTFPRYYKALKSTVTHGTLHGQAIQRARSITNSVGSTRSAAEISREAKLLAVVKHFPKIYDGIQDRLEGGDGVRTAFKAQVKDRVKWEITNDEVAIMIKGVAALGASLKIIWGSNRRNRLREFRVVKHKPRSKRHRSNTGCDLPRTWLSSDDMDTGP